MTDPRDELSLQGRAIALSEATVARGERPFGDVICDGEGRMVSEASFVAPVDPREMPLRFSLLPNYFERGALQKLLASGELPAVKLASVSTLKRMVAKGWIELASRRQAYLITAAGKVALKANLPSASNK